MMMCWSVKGAIAFTALIFILLFIAYGNAVLCSRGVHQFSLISGCICSGYNVTLKCSINGGGNTIWNGSAFTCPSGSESNNNQILLRHSGFGLQDSSVGRCNDGAIVAKGIDVSEMCFTSELNVTVSSGLIGKEISCFYENGTAEVPIGTETIRLTSGDELSSPSSISLTGVSPDMLTFEWTSVTHDCSAIRYNISASGCGDCPTITNTNVAECSVRRLQPILNEVLCSFSVQAVICDGIVGGRSNFTDVRLNVPSAPIIRVIPTYSQSNRSLQMISVAFSELLSLPISDHFNGFPVSYTVTFTNSTGDMCDSGIILPASHCEGTICIREFDVTSSLCIFFDLIGVTIFATNALGNGSMSNKIIVESRNTFVNIVNGSAPDTFFCSFSNKKDTGDKLCVIEYQQCRLLAVSSPMRLNATTKNGPNTYQFQLMLDRSNPAIYCYTVIASNGTHTVHVKGTLVYDPALDNAAAVIAGGVIGAFVFVAIFVTLVLVVIAVCKLNRKKTGESPEDMEMLSDLQRIEPNRFKKYDVTEKCELSSLIVKEKLNYRIGCVYYEFARKEEDVSDDKGVIFMEKESKTLFTGEKAKKAIGAPSKTLRRPNIPNYKVFVQSKGIGRRPLLKGTSILYEMNPPTSEDADSNDAQGLTPIPHGHFQVLSVKEESQLDEFIRNTCKLQFEPGCAYFEFSHETEDISKHKKVILMTRHKDNSPGDLFTGPEALSMIGAPALSIHKPYFEEWRVFIQSVYFGARHLDRGTLVLYKNPDNEKDFEEVHCDEYDVRKVPRNSQLLRFVVNDLNLEYEPFRFLFEFVTQIEAITDDKKVVVMNKETKKLFTGLEVQKMVGAPNTKVYNPNLKSYRVFIQNAGSGSRFLKSGTYLLIKKL